MHVCAVLPEYKSLCLWIPFSTPYLIFLYLNLVSELFSLQIPWHPQSNPDHFLSPLFSCHLYIYWYPSTPPFSNVFSSELKRHQVFAVYWGKMWRQIVCLGSCLSDVCTCACVPQSASCSEKELITHIFLLNKLKEVQRVGEKKTWEREDN